MKPKTENGAGPNARNLVFVHTCVDRRVAFDFMRLCIAQSVVPSEKILELIENFLAEGDNHQGAEPSGGDSFRPKVIITKKTAKARKPLKIKAFAGSVPTKTTKGKRK